MAGTRTTTAKTGDKSSPRAARDPSHTPKAPNHHDGPPRADRSAAITSDTKATQSRQRASEDDARDDRDGGRHGRNTEPDSGRKGSNFLRSKSASKMGG